MPGRNTGVGAAYVYTLRYGTWSRTAELTVPHGAIYDVFGKSVALSAAGTTALIGAPGRGAAYVFTLRHGTWSLTAQLTALHISPDANFGQSVALSATGSTAIVGVPDRDIDVGAVYVFTLRHGTWSLTAQLTASDAAPRSDFGYSVALSATGGTAVAGAPIHNSQTGAVYVFTLRRGTWFQTGELTASHGKQFEDFGQSVALSGRGSTVLAGMPLSTLAIGAADVFTLHHGTWSRSAELTASTAAPGDEFGSAVALSATGSTVLAGAPFRDQAAGGAYVFTLHHGTWSQSAGLTASDGAPGAEFGSDLALSATGRTVLAGAPDRSTAAVYVFAAR